MNGFANTKDAIKHPDGKISREGSGGGSRKRKCCDLMPYPPWIVTGKTHRFVNVGGEENNGRRAVTCDDG